MKKISGFTWLFLCIAMFLAGCASTGGYVDKEYVLPTETLSQVQKDINLEDYRIQEGAMLALGDLISIKDMVLENVCFYDKDNLAMIFLNEERTRLDAYLFSLTNASLNWMGTIEDLTKLDEIGNSYVIASVEPLVVMDEYTNSLWVIKDKTVQQKITLDIANVQSTAIGNNKVYYAHMGNDAIECVDFTSGQVETVYSGLDDYSYNMSRVTQVSDDGKYLYLTGISKLDIKETTFVIDLEQSKLVAEVEGIFDCWDSDEYMYATGITATGYSVHQRTEDNYTDVTVGDILPYEYFEYFVAHEDIAITEENSSGIYTFTYYDLADMKRLKSTNIDINSYFMYKYSQECNYSYCSVNSEFGYNADRNMLVYLVRTDAGFSNVFLWDINTAQKDGAALPGEDYIEEMDFQYVNEIDYDELTDMVHIMYDKYGVAVYIGDNTPAVFTDFSAVSEDDVDIMTSALTDVQEVLAAYPEGFFEFFREDEYLRGVNVYLVGSITTTSEGYADNPMGFANVSAGYEIIAIDVNYLDSVKETLVHEISHAIFERIQYEEMSTGTEIFDESKWNALNPKGFTYYNSYVDSKGDDISLQGDGTYTAQLYSPDTGLDNIYFVDEYSKTYITEDLARLMQYGMVHNEEEYMKSPKIIAKLNFYYDAIRAVWNTDNWPISTSWENKNNK